MDFEDLSTKYVGPIAENYERTRVGKKWHSEHAAIQSLLDRVKRGSKILDIPIGTGRLLPFFMAREFEVYGGDMSSDMLASAQANAEKLGLSARLDTADIRSIPFPDASFDLVVCIRFLNLIGTASVDGVVEELVRVSRSKLLIGARYLPPWSGFRLPADLLRMTSRLVRLPQIRAGRMHQTVHPRDHLTALFKKHRLKAVETKFVQRRWDGTEYVIFLLER